MVTDGGEIGRVVKSKRELGGNEGGPQGGGSAGGNTVTGVLIGGSGPTIRRHEEADASVVVWWRLSKEEGAVVGGAEGIYGELEDLVKELVWS